MRFFSFILAFGLSAAAAMAQDSGLRRMDTGDDTKGWEAVGRLEIGGRGFCTGALIADDLVLTAAHCLFDKKTGERIDHSEVEFRAGWRNGRAVAYRDVRRSVIHPEYVFKTRGGAERVRNDLALLELASPIRNTTVVPFETVAYMRSGDRLGIVSYAHDRAEAPSIQDACGVMGERDGVYVMTCSVDFGSSGAPVFRFDAGIPRIVSVVSAKAELRGEPVALGMSITAPLQILRAELSKGGGVYIDDAPRVNRIRVGEGRQSTGAKFLSVDGG